MTTKQDQLVNYVVTNGFLVTNSKEIEKYVSGMTANEIIDALEKALSIKQSLSQSSLGRELA